MKRVLLINFMNFFQVTATVSKSHVQAYRPLSRVWPSGRLSHSQHHLSNVSWAMPMCDRVPTVRQCGVAARCGCFPWSGCGAETLSHFVSSLGACQLGAKVMGKVTNSNTIIYLISIGWCQFFDGRSFSLQ